MGRINNDRVNIRGTVSRETADKMLRGELVNNNGVRTRRGNFNPEQPDIWIDQGPTFGEQMKQVARQEIIRGERRAMQMAGDYLVDQTLYNWGPRAFAAAKGFFKSLNQPTKASMIAERQRAAEPEPLVEPEKKEIPVAADNVISFEEFRKRRGA